MTSRWMICLGAMSLSVGVVVSPAAWSQVSPSPPPVPLTHTPPPELPAPDYKEVRVDIGIRFGARFQNPANVGAINDFGLDEAQVSLGLSGAVAPMIAWQAAFNALIPVNSNDGMGGFVGGPSGNGAGTLDGVGLLDLIGKLDVHPAFHLWVGRMIVPSDRKNFSGPWFISPGRIAGTSFPTYLGPRAGRQARDNGITAWGELGDGKAKYYIGAFNLNDSSISPMYAGRFNIALIGSEPGFYGNSAYYGSQDIVAMGGGFQYQNNAAVNATGANHTVFNVDLLAEKNLGAAGVFSMEAAYYHYPEFAATIPTGPGTNIAVVNHQYFVLAGYLTPEKIGIGKLNPLVRWQQSASPDWRVFDAYLTYVMDGHFLRSWVGYERTDFGGGSITGNAILLGFQMRR